MRFLSASTVLAGITVVCVAGCNGPLRQYTPQEEDASLIMIASGPASVQYSLSSTEGTCDGFEYVGHVSAGRYNYNPFQTLRNTSPEATKQPRRRALVPVTSELRIKAHGSIANASCGALVASFLPEKNKTYQIEYKWLDRGCRMDVSDISEPEKSKPVAVKMRSCPAPGSLGNILFKDGYLITR